jgi:cellulose synthase/poly-beta-1,6-N-acetylglucosamine synthase-like glycosyltransferase
MLVTEGKASRADRWVCAGVALGLLGSVTALFAVVPVVVAPVLWVSAVLGAAMVVRDLVFSVVARFLKTAPTPESDGRPSIAFVVPCLNELPSLQQTVPAMMALRYGGRLTFCYVLEGVSTDGSIQYVHECARQDPRIVPLHKETPPGGRGAAVDYGLRHAPPSDVVGFLDADHILDQDSLDETGRLFGRDGAPEAVQGVCATVESSDTALARLLTTEREWLERVELQANPRLGGICVFGGGQGFFVRRLLDKGTYAIDASMILDDIDLSCQLAVNGVRVAFDPHITTRSRQPETVSRFLDQRLRWARGWFQLAVRYICAPFRARSIPLALRADLLRLAMIPFAGAFMYFSFGAAIVALAMSGSHRPDIWMPLWVLFWPLLLSPMPYLAGVRPRGPGDVVLTALGIPVLTYVYGWAMGVSLADAYVLRRPARYAKTAK